MLEVLEITGSKENDTYASYTRLEGRMKLKQSKLSLQVTSCTPSLEHRKV